MSSNHKDDPAIAEGFTPWQVENEEDQEFKLQDLIKVVPHQKYWFIGIVLTVLVLGHFYIQSLPEIYVSKSSIMLEREGMFSSGNSSGSQDVLTLRMHSIIKTMLSTDSIFEILKSTGAVAEDAEKSAVMGQIRGFRGAARFDFENVSILRERWGREGLVSMGMEVSYRSTSPEMALAMTEELTDRLLGNNVGKMTEENQVRNDYLSETLNGLRTQLDEHESKLTAFKEENALSLPEMQSMAIGRIDNLNYRILQSQDRIKVLQDRADEIDVQLATATADSAVYTSDGKRLLSAGDQLAMLEVEYSEMRDKYSSSHPDRIQLEEKIKALREHVNSGGSALELELTLAKKELTSLRERYSALHPDVTDQEQRVRTLESQVKLDQGRANNNPVYTNLLLRARNIRGEISLERQTKNNLRQELNNVELRMQQMPAVEQQLRRLVSARDLVEGRYKQAERELAELMESAGMQQAELLEKFVLLESPDLPLAPSTPNTSVLYPAIFFASFGLAYAFVFVRHFVQRKITGSDDVASVTRLPVFLIPDFK